MNEVNSVTVYPAGARGHAAPIRTISGSNTELNFPQSMALDADKNIYTTNGLNPSEDWLVAVFAAGANGNVAPIRSISGSNTGLHDPAGIALDAGNNVYVTNGNNRVTVYAAGANGNVARIQAISGSNTRLRQPFGIAVNAEGQIYVMNAPNDQRA